MTALDASSMPLDPFRVTGQLMHYACNRARTSRQVMQITVGISKCCSAMDSIAGRWEPGDYLV